MRRILLLVATAFAAASCAATYDVCVYGGTSAGVMAAYSAAQSGQKVLLVSPEPVVGGMTTGGLGWTDIGNKYAVCGLAKQFYRKVGQHYGAFEQWIFEPHVAQEILDSYIDHPGITTVYGQRIESAEVRDKRISGIKLSGANGSAKVKAREFIDASYEGDLMACSGVTYATGREANSVYGETWNGVHMLDKHQFPDGVDPYVEKGKPESGLLWGISDNRLAAEGSGDNLLQAYNFRLCMSDDPQNMIPITRPENYDSTRYELLVRLFEAQPAMRNINQYFIWSIMPNHKTDVNNRGGFSTDMIGMNQDYIESGYAVRDSIFQAHKDYTMGLLWFYVSDPRVPAELQEYVRKWGYAADEYPKTGNWTHQLYVREGRRLVGEYVATQADCEGRVSPEDGVAMAAYTMDSHNTQRIVVFQDGKPMVKNEGDVEIKGGLPYPISYRSITPLRSECTNLLVPVCLSASHIAYGSIRMEPVFMALGQAAGIAASLAADSGKDVQEIPASSVSGKMAADPNMDGSAPDILIDEASCASWSKSWKVYKSNSGFGPSYLNLDASASAGATLSYTLPSGLSGKYDIYCFQQLSPKLNPLKIYTLDIEGKKSTFTLDASGTRIIGQSSGEWMHIGSANFTGSSTESSISVSIPEDSRPSRADALLLVPSSSE